MPLARLEHMESNDIVVLVDGGRVDNITIS